MATITETGTIDLKAQKEAHDEAISAAASDATTKANAAQSAAISTAASDATTKANAAQSAAISTAASDATTKANAAAKTATNYITPDGTSTAAFHPEASSTNQVKIDGTGVDIIKSGTSVAKYGEVARIGKSSESRVEIDFHSLKLIDKDGNTYLHVSDLRDVNGSARIFEDFIVDDNTEIHSNSTRFELSYLIKSPIADNIVSVKLDQVTLYTDEYGIYTDEYGINSQQYLSIYRELNLGQGVQIEYVTGSAVRAFSFGQRAPNSLIGAESFVEGYNNTASGRISHAEGRLTEASGIYSHAEGAGTKASGLISHAEGNSTKASGLISHAEGDFTEASDTASHAEGKFTKASGIYSHAEGSNTQANGSESHAEGSNTQANGLDSHAEGFNTQANGEDSHAEGSDTTAIGEASHSQNLGTIARGEAQTAIGKYNIDNTDMDLAFIIGNGTANNARSNAFAVDWDGNTSPSGKLRLVNPSTNRDNPGNSDVWDTTHCIELCDTDGERTALLRSLQRSDGRIGVSILACNEKTDGTEVTNDFNVYVARDGTKSYGLGDPAALRSAISALSTGDNTVTGLFKLKTSLINRDGTAPSSTVYDNSHCVEFTDADNENIGRVRMYQDTSGRVAITMQCRNEKTDGTEVINEIVAIVARDGTKSYALSDSAAFRNALGASSGVFPQSVGGTGITSNPSMLTNLGSTSAASVFAASPRPGVTGTLPRANGGTGATGRTTGTITRSGLTTDGTINVYSNGVTCTLAASNVKLKAALATSSTVQLATLPTGYRPPMNVFTNISSPAQSSNGGAWVRVDSSGVVTLGNYSGAQFTTSTQLYFTITWAL